MLSAEFEKRGFLTMKHTIQVELGLAESPVAEYARLASRLGQEYSGFDTCGAGLQGLLCPGLEFPIESI